MHHYLHWFWVVFFALFGVFHVFRARNFMSASYADCGLRADCETTARVEAAVERRQEAEGKAVPLGLWNGGLCFVLAAAAATGRIQPALLYAFMCFGMAGGVAAVFLRLRNSQPTRVAVLSARTASSVLPAYWLYAAIVGALGVLAYTTDAAYRDAATIVSFSSLVSIAITWRLANLPALLSGVDIPAEQLVDDRLRFFRCRSAMVFALVQTFVFCSQAIGAATTIQLVAYWMTFALWVAFAVWMIRRQYAAVRLA